MNAEVPHALELVGGFDAFGDDASAELGAERDHVPDDRLPSRQLVHVASQREIELDDAGVQICDTLQVGVTRAEIVNHQGGAGAAA